MRKILDSKTMKQCDLYTIENYTSSLELMEEAGKQCASFIKALGKKKILILCGSGNNGGDGYVIARILKDVDVFSIGSKYSEECKINKDLYKGRYVEKIVDKYDLVVDAIIGIGLKSDLKEELVDIVDKVNSLNAIKVAIDIPTGISSDTGLVMKSAIKCDYTLAIQNEKYGHYLNDGKSYCNEIKIIDIKVRLINYNYTNILDYYDYLTFFKKRDKTAHKGKNGRVSLIAGSKEYMGASYISNMALSSLRMGSGYQTLCIPQSLHPLYALKNPEITLKMMEDNNGEIKYNEKILDEIILKSDVIGIGMGTKVSKDIYDTINYLLKNYDKKLLIDADGLNSLSKYGIDILLDKKCEVILTPHLKEMERLTNIKVSNIKKDGLDICKEFSKKYNVITVLKSSTTFITDGKETYFNINGNQSLGKCGSGDVLSGIMCGTLSYSSNSLMSCAVACYTLGLCADNLLNKQSEYTVVSSDIVEEIKSVVRTFEG